MEISFEEPFDEPSYRFAGPMKISVLKQIDDERFNRRPSSVQKNQWKKDCNYDSPPSPVSLGEENKVFPQESVQIYKFPISQYSTDSFKPSSLNKPQEHTMHHQLKKPDFSQISNIFNNYTKIQEKCKYKESP